MPRNISAELKLQAVKEYLNGKGSLRFFARKYGVNKTAFEAWIRKYKALGNTAFIRSGHNNIYTAEFKIKVVNEYLNGNDNTKSICIKYKIPSISTLKKWIMKYNGHEKLKASGIGGSTIMTKGRITSFNERLEIVQYCIKHNHNYIETSEKYQISYQQARNYTVKYETGGIDALQDNRGKRKSENQMTELERLRAENKILQAEKERAEMEVSFLKKLEEIERRRG